MPFFRFHLAGAGAMTLLVVLCTFYPFLPGSYDRFAVALSAAARTVGIVGLLLVPPGALWLAHEFREDGRRRRGLPTKDRRYTFAVTTVAVSWIVATALSFAVGFELGFSFGLLVFAGWFYAVRRLVPRLRRMRSGGQASANPVPLYLVVVPIAVVLSQWALAGPAVQLSRNHAIANSQEVISEIEKYHVVHGHYPRSLLAVWPDFQPSVIGIDRYHYAPHRDAYNLFFEQSVFRWGTREFVVYNRLGQHFIPSHAAWNLSRTPEGLRTGRGAQGWYAAHDTSHPHWKYFWFD